MKNRLIKLLNATALANNKDCVPKELHAATLESMANYLLNNGVIVTPLPVTDELREELTSYVYHRCIDEL